MPSGIEKAIGIPKLFNFDLITLLIVQIALNRAIWSGFIFIAISMSYIEKPKYTFMSSLYHRYVQN